MKATVTVNLEKLKKMLPTIREKFGKLAGDPLLEAVLDAISKGLSPVQGEGRFQAYSETYREAILGGAYSKYGKGVRPVNLFLSGDMLGSGTTSPTDKGVRLSFPHFLADIHNKQGAGKSKVVRHFMPTVSGENYSRVVLGKVRDVLTDVVRAEVAAQNSYKG